MSARRPNSAVQGEGEGGRVREKEGKRDGRREGERERERKGKQR